MVRYLACVVAALLFPYVGPAGVAQGGTLRAHAVIDEAIVPGEGPDLAEIMAFTRARLEIVDSLRKAMARPPEQGLTDAIVDHVRFTTLRKVQQVEGPELHVLMEVEGVLESGAVVPASVAAPVFADARAEFEGLHETVKTLRKRVLAEEDESRRVEVLLQLERQDLELVDRACFQTYPLAGEAFCGDYQRTGGDDHRVSIMVARCGGDAAWRRYSPLHRVAAFLSQQLQELQASRVQPDALLSAHLQHKAVVLREYPYLSHIDEGALFRPFRWPDANGMREIPISEWTPMMRALVLEREIALWQGLTIGWHVFHGTASDRFCSPQVSPPSLNEAVVREPASE